MDMDIDMEKETEKEELRLATLPAKERRQLIAEYEWALRVLRNAD